MMNTTPQHEIDIEIDENGLIHSAVLGIRGEGCEGVSDWLNDLGECVSEAPNKEHGLRPALRSLNTKTKTVVRK